MQSSDLNAVQYEVKRLNDSLTKSNVEEVIEQFERLKTTNDAQKNIIIKLQRQIKVGGIDRGGRGDDDDNDGRRW